MSRIVDAFQVLRGRASLPSAPKIMDGELAFADPLRLFPGANAFPAYNPSVLVTRKGLRIFEEMRRDEQVKIALSFKKMAVLSSGWKIEVPDGRPEDWEPAEALRQDLAGLNGTVSSVLLGILTALDFGYSVTEKIFEERDGRIALADLKTKRPETFGFIQDEFGVVPPDGLVQSGTTKGELRLPTGKFLLFANADEFQNPYGRSDLEAAYRAWWVKDNAYKWLAMLLERFGIPPVFALYDQSVFNTSQQDQLKDIIRNLQARSSGIIPRGESKDALELWTPELAGQVHRVFIPALEKLDKDIARALLMPGTLGATPDESPGSFARAKVVFDVFMFAVEHLREELEEILHEQLFRDLTLLNFPLEANEVPRFRFLPITDDRRTDLLELWIKLLEAGGAKMTGEDEAHIRDLLDFPERDIEEGEIIGEDDEPDESDDGSSDDDEAEDDDESEDDRDLALHTHGVVMLPIKGDDARAVMALHSQLPDGASLVRDPHVTVRYGVDGDPVAVARALGEQHPVWAEIYDKALFETADDGDAIVLLLDGSGLRPIRDALDAEAEALGMIEERYPDYKPHVTLAYLPTGQGQAAMDALNIDGVRGRTMVLDTLEHFDPEGKRTVIPLSYPELEVAETASVPFAERHHHLPGKHDQEAHGKGGRKRDSLGSPYGTGEKLHKSLAEAQPDFSAQEKSAVKSYTAHNFKGPSEYEKINSDLRSGATLTRSRQRTIDNLDSAIDKTSLPEDTTVYRAMRSRRSGELPQLSEGATFTDKGFGSTTTEWYTAADFQLQGAAEHRLLRVELKQGQKALAIDRKLSSQSHGEMEVLLPRNRTFRVRSVETVDLPHRGSREIYNIEMLD